MRAIKHVLLFILYAIIGAVLAAVAGFVWLGVSGKPELKPWHTASLHEEFTRADSERITTLDAYRKLEERLFAELKVRFYQRTGPSDRLQLKPIFRRSRVDPTAFPENFNRAHSSSRLTPRARA